MRQIIIYILTTLAIAAAPNNREQINKQLNETVIPKIEDLNGFKIEEMITVLYKNSNKINFLYFPPKTQPQVNAFIMPTNNLPQLGLDPFNLGALPNQPFPPPAMNFPAQPPAPVEKDLVPTMKAVTGELRNLTTKQLLDIMVMGCVPPIQYVITDYGVVFLHAEKDKAYMPTRVFRLNRNFFK